VQRMRWHGVEGGSGGDTMCVGVARAQVRVRAGGGVTARRWCTGAAGARWKAAAARKVCVRRRRWLDGRRSEATDAGAGAGTRRRTDGERQSDGDGVTEAVAKGEGTAANDARRRWRRRRRDEDGGVRVTECERTEDVDGDAGARKTYDMWTPQFFLSPVEPTLRF
jgi:hypothetical protein